MATAKVASAKKNPQRIRMLDGKRVWPIWYNGKAVGNGSFMAGYVENPDNKGASYTDMMIWDENGKPKAFREIGNLEWE